jgi:hypothetical protein
VKTSTIIFCNRLLSVRHTGQKLSRGGWEKARKDSTWSRSLWQRVTAILLILLAQAARPCVGLSRQIILANLFSLSGRSHEREPLFFSHPLDALLGFYLFVSRPAELVLKCVAVSAREKEINQHQQVARSRRFSLRCWLIVWLQMRCDARVKFNGIAIKVPQLLGLGFWHLN